MKKIKIKENYEYWYFDNQLDFFDCLENMLADGYQITDSVHLCVELKKNEKSFLLSYIYVDEVNENIKEVLSSMDEPYKKVYPDYENCILNTISSIRKSFGGPLYYKTDARMDEILKEKSYKNVIIMLLDGLGENILEKNIDETSFLKQNHLYTNTAIYPSTTAASTTATICGKSPITTGWLGWENYFKEIKRNIILFSGLDYYTGEKTGFNAYQALPYTPFFQDLPVNGSIHMPKFSKKNYPFKRVLKHSLKKLKKKKNNIEYVYDIHPDHGLHEFGTTHEAIRTKLYEIDKNLKWYAKKLPKDTLLIISADHGHVDVEPIHLYACKTIQKMLKRPPSNDSRCITFSVLDEYRKEFPIIFHQLFGYAYEIYPSSDAIHKGFFGTEEDTPCARSYDFLADYVAVAKNKYYFKYKGKSASQYKSHHAGITAEEMLVPVIIYRK